MPGRRSGAPLPSDVVISTPSRRNTACVHELPWAPMRAALPVVSPPVSTRSVITSGTTVSSSVKRLPPLGRSPSASTVSVVPRGGRSIGPDGVCEAAGIAKDTKETTDTKAKTIFDRGTSRSGEFGRRCGSFLGSSQPRRRYNPSMLTETDAAFIDAIKAGEYERVKAMVSAEPALLDARGRTGESAILTAVY